MRLTPIRSTVLTAILFGNVILFPCGARSLFAEARAIATKVLDSVPVDVATVSWLVFDDGCSLEIRFPAVAEHPTAIAHEPARRTQAWLVTADGSIIRPRTLSSPLRLSIRRRTVDAEFYTFPASARTQAIAVALTIDEEFFVERLIAPR